MEHTRRKILVVDDIDINRIILMSLFQDRFDVLEAENGRIALDLIEKNKDDLAIVLLDIVMPVMDGFAVLREMNRLGLKQTIPVILITSESDDEKALTGYGLGVSDLVYKPFNSDIIVRRVNNVIELYTYQNHLEQKLLEQKEKLEKQSLKIKQNNLFLIDALSTTVEFRDSESGEHVKRIRFVTRMLLEKAREFYPLTNEQIDSISNASVLHDIGKVAIPDAILMKPGPLTKEEFEVMKAHTVRGCEILQSLNKFDDTEFYRYCYEICRYHHERWNGRGYPDGLQGEDIPVWAQATALADVYDALTSKRVYKAAYSHDEAYAMIIRGECGVFNPKMIKCFLAIEGQLNRNYRNATMQVGKIQPPMV